MHTSTHAHTVVAEQGTLLQHCKHPPGLALLQAVLAQLSKADMHKCIQFPASFNATMIFNIVFTNSKWPDMV